jgi:hypothetical protein
MPNGNGTDYAHMEMLTAMLRFRRKFGNPAYVALLGEFNAQRYQDIPETAYGEITMRCSAGIAGLDMEAMPEEGVEDDTPSIQDRLGEIAAKIYGVPKTNDFAIIAAGAPDIKTAFDRFATAVHSRPVAK